MELTDDVLAWLQQLSDSGEPPPWRSWIEGRDQVSGDSFIMVGSEADRRDDIYLSRENRPAGADDLDLVAAARTYLPVLVAEIRRLRAATTEK